MITYNLAGKKALVTGGASGIGLGAVELFARSGATVAMNDLSGSARLEQELARLQGEGLEVIAAPGNVGDPEAAPDMVCTAAEAMGGLDYLVNNAATPATDLPIPPDDLERQDEAFWNLLLNVNLIGPYRCTRAAVPYLKAARGAVVSTASISAFKAGGSSSVYAVTKAGLVMVTRELAKGLAPEVRVNAIAPGVVVSNWQCEFGYTEDYVRETVPLQRRGTPADYAEVIVFLAAGASYVTGETVTVDGGWMA